MKKSLLLLFLVGCACLHRVSAADALLIPPAGAVQAGRTLKLTIYLNNPSAEPFDFTVPDEIRADLAGVNEQRRLLGVPVGIEGGTKMTLAPMSFATITVAVVLPDTLDGTVSLRFVDLRTNPVMFVVNPAAVVRATPRAVAAATHAADDKEDDVDLTTDRENIQRHISAYEPIYFAFGLRDGANARFQFSFKYLIFTANNNDPEWWRTLYLGYTQTSLWDLSSPSKPFYDTSYKPTIFYYHESFRWKPLGLSRFGLQAGLQHESNGKGVTDSRSINTAYITPIGTWAVGGKWRLQVAPRLIAYAEKSENADLARYRGNVELMLRFGQDKKLQMTTLLRKGNGTGYGSGQFDATYPLHLVPGVSPNAGGYLQVQYFNGWGESLLDYNKRRTDQLRFGYMLVR
ncbi:MAG: hypothetical protein JWM32_598 [Verrucomicrobia bacterium]|nr:hypothetical protein [Verrucomicrobiota bacterium]